MMPYQDTECRQAMQRHRTILQGVVSVLATAGLAGSMLLQMPADAQARVRCPEGKTASGECIDPGLGSATRQAAIVFSQPKLSETGFPLLPVDDWTYRYPNALINDPLSGPAVHCNLVRGACR